MVIRLNYSYITVYFNIWQCIKYISPRPSPLTSCPGSGGRGSGGGEGAWYCHSAMIIAYNKLPAGDIGNEPAPIRPQYRVNQIKWSPLFLSSETHSLNKIITWHSPKSIISYPSFLFYSSFVIQDSHWDNDIN